MVKKILGLDLGTNSIGWALLQEEEGIPTSIIDSGCRIFIRAVEEKTPTPKNAKRRNARLSRRVIQRRARRKQRLLNYLVSLDLLPKELQGHTQPEILLNTLGDPYQLRAQALDKPLKKYELGRVFLHLVQRRGFLSSRKTILGDMIDDPDIQAVLDELEQTEDISDEQSKEETAFKKDINELRNAITETGCRTLGEYLATLDRHDCKRNRSHAGGHLRTDRQMYRQELDLIWQQQAQYHEVLTDTVKSQIEHIIFHQRPLKQLSDRIGKCSLEPSRPRARIARLECQRFRYMQDINNLQYFNPYEETWVSLSQEDREKLIELFEVNPNVTYTKIRKTLGLDRQTEFNLENSKTKFKGNITASEIRAVIPSWDEMTEAEQKNLVEDLLTIKKKSVLKKRLTQHWRFDAIKAVKLCLLEFEPGHSNLSVKAINRLLPHLYNGEIYSTARVSAGYGYEVQKVEIQSKLGVPPDIPNPIVRKALQELRRVINALIAEYGRPDCIRIEMARDLEMNTKRYKAFIKRQKENAAANEEAVEKYQEIGKKNAHLRLSKYPSRDDKMKYRLWKDQNGLCAYSGKTINLTALFSADVDVDHILPYSESLDDSYMNKVVCYTAENRTKGQRTPIDAFGGTDKWEQITQALQHWDKKLTGKKSRFFMTASQLRDRDFISSQLNDTRYISRVALEYLKQLGSDVIVSKGITTAWLRRQWGLDSLLGTEMKERTDHRHHIIDAVVIGCVDRKLYQTMVRIAKQLERARSELKITDMHLDPPWTSLRDDLKAELERVVVAHAPHYKITGELHEETGAGFIEGVGTVYRVPLNGDFKASQVKKIIDDDVRQIVETHLSKYESAKQAFAGGTTVYHKDKKTPIKRVRIVQSKTTRTKLEKTKFGAKDKRGKVFRWMSFGNLHHIEVLKHKDTGKYVGAIVTMMEASHRARGINRPKGPIIEQDHGDQYEFVMALHINDLVQIIQGNHTRLYRVRKLGQLNQGNQPRPTLNLHSDARDGKTEMSDSIDNLMKQWNMQVVKVNAIGKIIGDKADHRH